MRMFFGRAIFILTHVITISAPTIQQQCNNNILSIVHTINEKLDE